MATVIVEYFGDEATEKEKVSDLGTHYHLPKRFPGSAELLEKGRPVINQLADPNLPQPVRAHPFISME